MFFVSFISIQNGRLIGVCLLPKYHQCLFTVCPVSSNCLRLLFDFVELSLNCGVPLILHFSGSIIIACFVCAPHSKFSSGTHRQTSLNLVNRLESTKHFFDEVESGLFVRTCL